MCLPLDIILIKPNPIHIIKHYFSPNYTFRFQVVSSLEVFWRHSFYFSTCAICFKHNKSWWTILITSIYSRLICRNKMNASKTYINIMLLIYVWRKTVQEEENCSLLAIKQWVVVILTDVLGQSVGPIFKHKKFKADRLSQNISKELPLFAA